MKYSKEIAAWKSYAADMEYLAEDIGFVYEADCKKKTDPILVGSIILEYYLQKHQMLKTDIVPNLHNVCSWFNHSGITIDMIEFVAMAYAKANEEGNPYIGKTLYDEIQDGKRI